jgi:hypothetical protein
MLFGQGGQRIAQIASTILDPQLLQPSGFDCTRNSRRQLLTEDQSLGPTALFSQDACLALKDRMKTGQNNNEDGCESVREMATRSLVIVRNSSSGCAEEHYA